VVGHLFRLVQRPEEIAGLATGLILAFPIVTITLPLLRKLAESGKPTGQSSVPYAGHDWTHGAAYMQEGAKIS
jgi:hypothetical protein